MEDARGAYIGVEADFALEVRGEVIYSEVMVPIVELVAALRAWLASSKADDREDFEWDSMSTPERGWVWIRRAADGWRVGSIHQDRAVVEVWSSDLIASAVDEFCTDVIARGHKELNADLTRWID